MADPVKIYWDSCAWIALINGESDRLPDVRAVYGLARRGLVEIWSSTIAIVEANRLQSEMTMAKPIPPESILKIDDLLFQPFVHLINLDQTVAKRARKLMRETTGLRKGADAIHLASAVIWNVPVFHTYDGSDLLHLNGSIACIDGTKMDIVTPRSPFDGGLFNGEQAAN